MHTYVISAEERYRIMDFLKNYRPLLVSEWEQMALLKDKLNGAVIVPETRLSRTIVSMYSTVRIMDVARHEVETYTLVYPQQASVGQGQLSLLSPLGTALLGCNEGDFFECAVPEGAIKYVLKELLYQPERSERSRS